MHELSVVVQQPVHASRLVLLFHGVGSTAANLAPLGDAIARAFPNAAVVSVDAPHASTLGSGREWFSVIGVTEHDQPARIAQAMPMFQQCVDHWQRKTGLAAAQTFLVGVSQGAIMSLESTQTERLQGLISRNQRCRRSKTCSFSWDTLGTNEGLKMAMYHYVRLFQ